MESRRRNWTLRGTYLYLTCLASLVFLVVGAGRTIAVLVDIANPPPSEVPGSVLQPNVAGLSGPLRPPPAVVEAQARLEAERRSEEARGPWRRLAVGLAGVAAALPAYLYGWKLIRREERQGRWPQVEWGVRNLYFYLVSLGALVALLVTVTVLASAVSQVAVPPPSYYPGPLEVHSMMVTEGKQSPSLSEIQARVDSERRRAEAMDRYHRRRSLISSAVSVAVALALYLTHWSRCQRGFSAVAGAASGG
ncbi:MAG: hypothetical protein K6T75_06065 [Acetobacteraceae bacterium]|nr:hypothetical protein [Acetobacteraceae bacterium]